MKEPKDTKAEYAVLAGMMNNRDCLYDGAAVLTDDYFSEDITIKLFQKISGYSEKGMAKVDTLIGEFTDPKEKAHIRVIDGAYVDRDHFVHSLDKLKDIHLKRQLYYTTKKALSRLSEDEADGQEILSDLERGINSVQYDDSSMNMLDPSERAVDGLANFFERVNDPNKFKGIPYSLQTERGVIGFPSLNKALTGAKGGDLVMLAAKTGEGKTALAISIARLFSIKQQYWGYYQNTEMQLDEMEARLLAPIARVTAKEILSGEMEGTKSEIDSKVNRVSQAYNVYKNSHLFLSRIPSLPLHKAKGLAKQMKNKHKHLDYLIVDYVGRMDLSNKDRHMQFWDVMYEIIKQLKELAMEMNIPIFVLAQRNQAGEVEGAKKMMNECDAVLYFEPVTGEDAEQIERTYNNPEKRKLANYKIVKKKVRRDDNPYPIYCNFDKSLQFINEVPLF